MYSPIGPASRLAYASTATPADPGAGSPAPAPVLGLVPCAPCPLGAAAAAIPAGLFLSWSAAELVLWHTRPRVALAKVVRSSASLARLGVNDAVRWGHSSRAIVARTARSALLIYALRLLSDDPVYKLPPDQADSFLSTGPAERIPLPNIALSFVAEVHPVQIYQSITAYELTPTHITVCSSGPKPQIQTIPWPSHTGLDCPQQEQTSHSATLLSHLDWLVGPCAVIVSMVFSEPWNIYVLVTSDGRAYISQQVNFRWIGRVFHCPVLSEDSSDVHYDGLLPKAIGPCSINLRFSLVAIGLDRGQVAVYNLGRSDTSVSLSHTLDLNKTLNNPSQSELGQVKACSWTSDGHALAICWSSGFSIWSVFGRLQAWSNSLPQDGDDGHRTARLDWEDQFLGSGRDLTVHLECLQMIQFMSYPLPKVQSPHFIPLTTPNMLFYNWTIAYGFIEGLIGLICR